MKIQFIFPKWEKLLESRPELKETLAGYHVGDFNMVSIGLTTVAAVTPPEHEIELVDDHFDTIDYNTDADIIAIGGFVPQATRAYHIADRFRKSGKTVVMGGIHATLVPEETLEHCDTVFVGDAEETWPRYLEDFQAGNQKRLYKQAHLSKELCGQPSPRRDLFKKHGYVKMDVVQTARGCAFNCEPCIIPAAYGRTLRYRPVDDVVKEIAGLDCEIFYFADDHLLVGSAANVDYAKDLFTAMAPLNKKFYISGSLSMITANTEILSLAREAGCKQLYLVYGFDPISNNGLNKGRMRHLNERTKRVIDSGIECFASFGLGFDEQDDGVFDRILTYASTSGIEMAEFFLATPYPQTPFRDRLEREGRLFNRPWAHYNGAYVVFQPKNFTEEALLDGYLYCWKEYYGSLTKKSFNERIAMKLYNTTSEEYEAERQARLRGRNKV